ncbi:flagellar basal body-associated protein FliL [Nocardioides sp.]|uniref:flagellar basal body-associated FliL family protein n=1 Tax=Nocardioides sp. TaxID=35761 RepID=UPI002600221B|nr:flagellar basal body-associated FliL family protein [Nocardioides sp.]
MSVTAIKATKADKATDSDEGKDKDKKGGKKKLLMIVAVVLLVAGAAYWFVLKPSSGAEEGPKPGLIVPLEPTQINLASGHYLKLGIALQMVEGAPEDVDGSKALDAAIDLFSGRTVEEVSTAKERRALKEELATTLEKSYEEEVMGVYFTEFVTQ